MTVYIEDILVISLSQSGKRYVYGAEASPLDPNPSSFDCSELVQWSCDRANVSPKFPDGSGAQFAACAAAGTLMTVQEGIETRGALLFRGGKVGNEHVAWSLGNGTTIEARGAAWGVGTWAASGRFENAGRIPGVAYTPRINGWATEREADSMRQFVAPTPWKAQDIPGRDPFVVVNDVPGVPNEFTVVSFNGAPHSPVPWAMGQSDPGWRDEISLGLWVRHWTIATGYPLGVLALSDRVVVCCEGGGTYTVSQNK